MRTLKPWNECETCRGSGKEDSADEDGHFQADCSACKGEGGFEEDPENAGLCLVEMYRSASLPFSDSD